MPAVYTIGHSNHQPSALLLLLQRHGIRLVVDVRSSPYSRYVPQANRETLAAFLESAGMRYRWMGDRLGGKPEGAVADYDELRTGSGFRQGIERLVMLAAEDRCVLMCAEGDHRRCHRHKLIAPALLKLGVQVLHIQPDGSVIEEREEPHQLALF